MARSRAATLISTPESEFREIIAWYEDQLATTTPPMGLVWEPVKIGPTWQYDNGWLLPELTLGWRVLAWCGKWLRDSRGQPWQFTPEQTRFVLWFFAVDEHGDFLFHSAVLQRLKGWGKDPVAAALSCAACFAEVAFDGWSNGRPVGREESAAWVQIIAVSQEQTANTMKLFPSLLPLETRRFYGIQPGKLNVFGLGDTRQIQAVTSSPLSVEGGRPTLVIRAETQNWLASNGGHAMSGALEGNAAKSEGGRARMLDICNAYRPGEDSVGERMREAYEATLGGEDARTAEFGLLYDSLEAPPDAPLTAEAAPEVVKSIAGDSHWLDTRPNGRIVKSILNPANPPSESRRKWYNQITATADAWIEPRDFDRCSDPQQLADGEKILMFFDAAKSDDATALVGVRISDGFVACLGVWQRPPHRKDWVVDRAAVDRRVREVFERLQPLGFWADLSDARDDETGARYWEGYVDAWAEEFGARLRYLPAVKTGPSRHAIAWDMRNPMHLKLFTEEAERTATDIGEGTLRHDGNELLRQHTRNARRRPNKFGISIGKEHRESQRKIDAAVCMVGARLMWRQWLARPTQGKRAPGKGRVIVMS
ncbi:terminase [Nocardia puris]|uniref:terminase n=1 Tax=Nocardia puris TaxID=208602 RepID=UPI001893C091|nr:terminase [Nocardia puris]MBF6459813.1 terminase [Nocardia puris]